MKFCTECGARLEDEVRTCPYCGKVLARRARTETDADTTNLVEANAKKRSSKKRKKRRRRILKRICSMGIILLLILSVIFGIRSMSDSYRKPVKLLGNFSQGKAWDEERVIDFLKKLSGGLGKKELGKALKDLRGSEKWSDKAQDYNFMLTDYMLTYGKNYKMSIKIGSKEKLDREELAEYCDEIRENGYTLYEKMTDDSVIERYTDKYDISYAEAKKLVEHLQAWAKVLSKTNVSKGYRLSLSVAITGNLLSEPKEIEVEMIVCKVNGHWTYMSMESGTSSFLSSSIEKMPSVLSLFN